MRAIFALAISAVLLSGCGDSEETKQRIGFVANYRTACLQEKKPYQCEYDIQMLTAIWGAKDQAESAATYAATSMAVGISAGVVAGGRR